jgi:hypothetical protein
MTIALHDQAVLRGWRSRRRMLWLVWKSFLLALSVLLPLIHPFGSALVSLEHFLNRCSPFEGCARCFFLKKAT